MTTGSEWRTDRPEVGRVVEDRAGVIQRMGCIATSARWMECAREHPETEAWQYIDPSPEMLAAADLGTACAWVEVFARVVVPLGAVEWRTGRPEVGRLIKRRDGEMWVVYSEDAATELGSASRSAGGEWHYIESPNLADHT